MVGIGGIYGSNTSSMSVILGNGDGTIRTPVMYTNVSCDSPVIADVDVNGDGRPDIVISGTLTVLLGNGDDSFQPPITTPFSTTLRFPTGSASTSLAPRSPLLPDCARFEFHSLFFPELLSSSSRCHCTVECADQGSSSPPLIGDRLSHPIY